MRCWLPEAAIERRSQMKDQLDAWIRAGFITVTPGDVLDYRAVKQEVIDLAGYFDMRACGFDPWQATQIAIELNEELGDDFMVPVRQGFRTLSAPSKLLETLVGRGLDGLNHGGHPVLRWCADNVVAEVNADGAIKPSKKKSSEKIDLLAALVTGLERAMNREEQGDVQFVSFNS
jgi:phage terminase large subunit-like protein